MVARRRRRLFLMHQLAQNVDNLVIVQVNGKLTHQDCDTLTPGRGRVIVGHGRTIRLRVTMEDFHGWDPGAAWRSG
jgi:hypothetical protein